MVNSIKFKCKTAFYYYCPVRRSKAPTYNEAIKLLATLRHDRSDNTSTESLTESLTEPMSVDDCDLSVIIPVYNAEPYIEACLRSVINQDTKYRYEIIVVDDGSTDNSLQLIRRHSHPKLRYCSKPNGGIGSSRNLGIRAAKGKYLMFVDADDELLPNAIQQLLDAIIENDACIAQGNVCYFHESDKSTYLGDPTSQRKLIQIQDNRDLIFNLGGYPWAKVFKKQLFENAFFPLHTFEDTLIWLIIYRRAKSILVIPEAVYLHRFQPNSDMASVAAGSVKGIDTLYVVSYLLTLHERLGLPFDDTLYRQILFQFGRLMYDRTYKLGETVLSSLLVVARVTLLKYQRYSPSAMSKQERYLNRAIMRADLELYKRSVLYL